MNDKQTMRKEGKKIIEETLKEKIADVNVQWRQVDNIGGPGDATFALEVAVNGKELWQGGVKFMDLESIAAGSDETLQKVISEIVEHFSDPPERIGLV